MILASSYCIFIPIAYTYKIKKPSFFRFAIFSFLAFILSFVTLITYIRFFDHNIIFTITDPKIIIPATCIVTTTILIIKKQKKENGE